MKGLYKITDKISNKVYIGQSSNLASRFNAHISDFENGKGLKKHNPELQIENLIFEIIEICENEEVLDERERYWIKYYDSFFNGFNRTMGGKKWGEEEKQLVKEGKHPLYKRTAFYYPEIPQSYLRRWLSLDECRTLAKELDVRKRMYEALMEVISNNKGKRIAIFSHAYAMMFLLLKWCELIEVRNNQELAFCFKDKVVFDKGINSPDVFKLP